MRYENVSNMEELNFRVSNYINSGYKLEIQGNNYVKLIKDDFNWAIFILLLIFLVIGALIYWAIVSGNKDEVVIKVGNEFNNANINNNANNNNFNNSDVNDSNVTYNIPINSKDMTCHSCGFANKDGSKFCHKCGSELNDIEDSSSKKCPNCGMSNNEGSKFCYSCGYDLNIQNNQDNHHNQYNQDNDQDNQDNTGNIDNESNGINENEKFNSINKCANCGTTNPEDSKFCYSCGKSFE